MHPQGLTLWRLNLQSSTLWSKPAYIETCTGWTVEYFLRVSASHRFLHVSNFHPIVTYVNFLLTISINNKDKK